MKRIIATLMIVALMATMLLSFAACGKAGAEKVLKKNADIVATYNQ